MTFMPATRTVLTGEQEGSDDEQQAGNPQWHDTSPTVKYTD